MNKATPTEDEEKLAKKIAARLGASWFTSGTAILEEIMQHNRQTTEEAYVDPKQLPLGLVENDWE